MPLSTFTVTINGDQLGEKPERTAKVRVQIAGSGTDVRAFIKDADADKFVFPHETNPRPESVSLPYTLTLKTDVTTGVSTAIGYLVTVTTEYGGVVTVGPFGARPTGSTVALVDLASDFEGQVAESIATRAETAAASAQASAASVQREQANGVAGLDASGKLIEDRLPTNLGLGKPATGVAATDRANLQAILNASATVRQRLPRGTYLINAGLTIPAGADIDFGGATIRRAPGTGVFDMLTATNATGLKLSNLTIDGNKTVDTLVAENAAHRFGGLVLNTVTDSTLNNITVTGTVNNENTAGIYLNSCADIYARGLNGWSNDRTAIMLNVSSRITIDGSLTYNNLGSGITSISSPECAYLNVVAHDNGYSNLSVNGVRCRVSNALLYNSAYSGLNIGHSTQPSDDTVVTNVQAYSNGYEGITVTNSARVLVNNFEVHNNTRHNVRTMTGASGCRFTNGVVRNSAGGQGIFFEAGGGHSVSQVDVFANFASGINLPASATNVQIGPGVRCYNNGIGLTANSAGVLVNTATNVRLVGVECFDDQTTKTQESGVWLAGGSGHVLTGCRIEGNKTNQLRTSSSPQYVYYQGDGATGAARVTCTSFVVASGTLGFFGVAPVAKAAANPDTAGATLAQLETEVNELKAMLRNYGLLS